MLFFEELNPETAGEGEGGGVLTPTLWFFDKSIF